MSTISTDTSLLPLTKQTYEFAIKRIADYLNSKVLEAFVFGSAGTEAMNEESDIDLILVVEVVTEPFFPHRPLAFRELYNIYSRIDMLVYTPQELKAKLDDSSVGFWKSVKESMRRIV